MAKRALLGEKVKVEAMMREEKRQKELAVKEAQEKERKRIAAELHDNLGVQANAILHNSSLLNGQSGNNKLITAGIQETAKEMLNNLRETVWAMKTADVPAKDLWLRIINFIKQMGRRYTRISFTMQGDAPENYTIISHRALNIILTLQETVNNAVKHAGAAAINVSGRIENCDWLIEVTDDGKGFDLNAAKDKSGSYGLQNMQERAIAGSFIYSISTAPGCGTAVTIKISG